MSSLTVRRLPIRVRIAFWYTVFILSTIAVIGVYLLAMLENNLLREIDDALQRRAHFVENRVAAASGLGLETGIIVGGLLEFPVLEEFSAPGIYVEVVDADGAVIASSQNLSGERLPTTDEVLAEALSGRESYYDLPAGTEKVRVLAKPLHDGKATVGVLLVGESLHFKQVTLLKTRRILLTAALVAGIASLLGGWWLTGRAMGPIAGIVSVAKQISATGRFEQRLPSAPAHDELGELTATLNAMLQRLEHTFRRQGEFVADASHELRGPLAVVRGNLDLLKLGLPPEESKRCVLEATEEMERISRLVSDLLFLAEVDALETVQHQRLDAREVLVEVYERALAVDAGNHQVELLGNDETIVEGDRDRLIQMLWNLVENALRYSPSGTAMSLLLRNHGPVAEFAVADQGIGVPAEHLPRIFDRFYRVDRSRSRAQGGTGLGLAIVKHIAEAHGGQVRVRSEPGIGSTFTVTLPAQEGLALSLPRLGVTTTTN